MVDYALLYAGAGQDYGEIVTLKPNSPLRTIVAGSKYIQGALTRVFLPLVFPSNNSPYRPLRHRYALVFGDSAENTNPY
jgi:hypothetical protein